MSTLHTLTGNLRDVVPGAVPTVHSAYIETNVPDDQALVGTGTDGGIAPSNVGRIPLAGDTFTLQLLATDSTDLNVAPNTLRYRVHVQYGRPGVKGVFDWYSDWFPLTAPADLKTVIGELELVPPSTRADELDERITALEESGTGGGTTSALIVVSGGSLDLDNTKPDGFLIGYRVTSTTTIEGMSFSAGSYVFERASTVTSGWTYRAIAAATEVTFVPDTTAPTAPTLTVNNSSPTQLVATFSGGTDSVGVTQYRSRIDGGSWTVAASPRTFSALTASSTHTIDVQAGDAAGNWSPSASWTGSTAAVADTTPPTAGTLTSSSITDTTFALTVSGASDTGGLAAAPYSFSTDNGSTWSAYQSSANYNATGKTASTAYQCKHRVKDAAGNVSTGTAITVTTSAPSIASDNFDRADTTSGLGTASDGKVWTGTANVARIVGNRVAFTNNGQGFATLRLDVGASNYTIDVDAPTYAASGDASLTVRWQDDSHQFFIYAGGGVGGKYSITKLNGSGSYSFPLTTTVTPAAGDHIRVVCTSTTIQLIVNGVSLGTVTDSAFNTGTSVGFTTADAASTTFDNLVVT